MGKQLYPIVYKPGIKRDGTLFQGDYCTDGQWVRFRAGNVRKIGGMKAFNHPAVTNLTKVSNITVIPDVVTDTNIIIYIAAGKGTIGRYYVTQDFNTSAVPVVVYNIPGNLAPLIWESEIVIQGNNQRIIFVGSDSFLNINTNSVSTLLIGNLFGVNFNLTPFPTPPNLIGVSGVLFVNPYLFVYGSNGLLQWSRDTDITSFTGGTSGSISISIDKIIDVRVIRGGVNSPTLLCWTLTSVVRLINTGSGGILDFRKDVLSNSSSILSSRCVVEYDGIFFWAGTDRFFQYNGVVQKLPNNMSQQYFFNNVDMDNRQLAFGVKHTKYNEIWWFYPEKGQDANIAPIINTRALIYNIDDNAWYDTAISRDAAFYSEAFGFMATYGKSLTTPNAKTTIYRHEYETFVKPQLQNEAIKEAVPVGNNQDVNYVAIVSSFTTPIISWAAFNPMKQLTGIDRWMYLERIEPDFVLLTDIMGVRIMSKQFAQSSPVFSATAIINDPTGNHDPLLDKVDMAFQGKHLSLVFTGSGNFEMGHVLILLGTGDGR